MAKNIPPVFISGFNKSGTTLLLSLLDNHPQLLVLPEELHFFNSVLFSRDKWDTIRKATGFRMFMEDSYLNDWAQGKSWFKNGYPEYDKKRFCELLEKIKAKRLSTKALLYGLFECFAEADNIKIRERCYWVSKTTQNEIHFSIMQKMFRRLQFYYIIRDPRDVWTSYIKRKAAASDKEQDRKFQLIKFASNWKVQVNQALALSEKRKKFCILRYEDIVSNTSEVMKHIAEQLAIKFNPSMLYPTRHGNTWEGNSIFSEVFCNLSQKPIGRYKKILPSFEKKWLEAMLHKEISKFGYKINDRNADSKPIDQDIRYEYYQYYFIAKYKYFLKKKSKLIFNKILDIMV